jgi:AraC-like DNA-binding protein
VRQDSDFRFTKSAHIPALTVLRAAFSDFHYDRHAHDEYCFGVTLAGRQDFFSAGNYYRSPPGNVIRFNPGQVHDGASGGDEPLDYVMLYIPPDQLEPLFSEAAGPASDRGFRAGEALLRDAALRRRILDLARLVSLGIGSRIEQEYGLYGIAARVQQLDGRFEPDRAVRRVDRLLHRARDYIHDHVGNDLALEDISEAAHLSKYHFLRLFRRQFGITPHQYVLNCRINAARRELDAGASPNDVVQRYGFCDLSHFNRRFKRIYGMTPSQYRESVVL